MSRKYSRVYDSHTHCTLITLVLYTDDLMHGYNKLEMQSLILLDYLWIVCEDFH